VVGDLKDENEEVEVLSAMDYYPFGMIAKAYNSQNYRYGFNGMEKDDEITGSSGTHYTAEHWQYDSRLGRRWNVDPVYKLHESPYACFANNPIGFIDHNGADSSEYKIVAEHDKELKDFAGKIKGTLDQMKELQGKFDKLKNLANAADGVINMSGTPQENFNAVMELNNSLAGFLPKGSSATFFITQMKMLSPLIERSLNMIAAGYRARNHEMARIGALGGEDYNFVMYPGAFPGGHAVYEYMQEVKTALTTYKDNQGNFSWGKYIDANNGKGKILVPNEVQTFVKNNYELLQFMTGTTPPFKTETFMGVDWLAPDTNTGGGVYWFMTNFETLQGSLYGGLKVQTK